MEGKTANEILKKIFEAHNVEFSEKNGWVIPYSKLPAIRSTWYPNDEKSSGLLQIEVFIEEGKILEECFAGFPSDNGKLNDAYENFSRNSLHVMLSAFWEKHDPQQVEKESWNINNSSYSIYIGPFGNRGGNGIEPRIPENTLDQIENAIKRTNITDKYNWFRTFYGNVGNSETVYEALKNNETWSEGLDALKSVNWVMSDQYYSTRNFIIVVKNT